MLAISSRQCSTAKTKFTSTNRARSSEQSLLIRQPSSRLILRSLMSSRFCCSRMGRRQLKSFLQKLVDLGFKPATSPATFLSDQNNNHASRRYLSVHQEYFRNT